MDMIIYQVLYAGEDGRGKLEEVGAFHNIEERDSYFSSLKYAEQLYIKTSKIVDSTKLKNDIYKKLSPTERLLLEIQ